MQLSIRMRSAKLKRLAQMAVSQGFEQKVTGSRHLGLICPTCKEMTILSGSQRDVTVHRYMNQEVRLRNHGLVVDGKTERKCGSVRRNAA